MESGNGGASSKGVLVPVPESSDAFHNSILAPLKSAYLYEESKLSFKYNSAFLVKNPALEKKYNAFRAKRKAAGYSEEDLKESYGFLLFDDVNKANTLGESGVLTGNSSCTTLGNPSNGIYISMYSDCLDLNRWYHGKSGYIAIIRLTKGRVKNVSENYTQDFTAPTTGFDCHVSDQLPSVSDKTSSFLAFERTQYYMYELLDDGSNETAQSPSAACPYAVVSFSYTDTKAAHVAPQENSEEKKLVCHYITWRGQLQICDQFYDVRLRSTSGASLPAKLPPVVKADRAISMLTLRQMLPRAVFETCHSVFLDELWCSHCEFVSSEVEETNSLSQLLFEIKKTDVALTIPLNDGGFLFLVHSSHFLMYDDTGSCVPEVLQGVFVFPDSRVIPRDTKCGHRKPAMSSEILRVLPVLSYAEGEAEKTPIDPSEELSEVLAQHMQSYAALINPGLDIIPSREVSIFADQYDVPDAHKHLYTSPEWTNRAWQSLKSYLSKPVSFQLPLAKASEILMVGQENRMEDLEDDIYICLSSPEEAPANDAGICSEDQFAGQTSVNVETSVDSSVTSVEAPLDLSNASQNVAPCDVQAGGSDKDTDKSELSGGIKTDVKRTKNLIPSTSEELPAELIVSITSAERTDENVIRNESATKHNGTQISDFSTAKSNAARVNPLNDEADKTTKVLDSSELNNLTKTKQRKVRMGPFKHPRKVSNACVETDSLPTVKTPVENDNFKSQEDNLAKEPEDHQQLSNPPIADWRKVRRRKRIFGKLSPRSKKMKPCTPGVTVSEEEKADPEQQTSESTILIEIEALPLRRKTERWDLKPVVSTCGRILVPHGSADVADKIKSLQDELQSTTNDKCHDKMLVVASMEAKDTVEMDHELNGVPETTGDEIEKDEDKENPHGHVSPEHSISRLFDASSDSSNVNPESSEQSTKIEVTDTSSSQAVQEKHSDTLPSGKCSTKGEFLLSKLKSVLLRGKRKIDLLGSEQTAEATAQDTESSLKLSKVDSETSILKSNDTITSVEDANLGYNEVSKMLSVDPIFAFALGLTPIGIPKMAQKTDSLSTEQRKDLSQTQEQTVFDKQPQIILRPPSIFPRRGRIKTLKKHQDVSAENVKKKWWLHFQTPASYASDKLNNKQCDKNNSVRKTVKEKLSSACPSTDALTLLADLALSASHDQVPTQPDPALGRQPETSLKKGDLIKDVTSVDQESVLHALLRQPAVRPIQPVESPSPSHLVGGSELVDLVSKEHAYSLPPSSSLPLGLPGTPFQVSPLSGSTGLLHHQKTMYDDGSRPQQPSVLKDGGEHNFGASEFLKKNIVHRRKFRHSRTFVSKDGSIEVTKQWEENYDFNQDSKFASDPKDKAIIRALHGPWDQSLQDTNEEVRLIVHMWIGLFYSRSTARFFHIDPDGTPDVTHPCSAESGSLEMSSAVVSSSDQSELKAISDEPLPNVTNTSDPSTFKALDLSKKDDSASDQGSSILDLSLKNPIAEVVTSDLQVNKKVTHVSREWIEASNPLNTQQSSKRPQEASPFQVCREIVLSTQAINGMNHLRGAFTGFYTPLQFQLTSVSSFKDVALIPVQNANKSVPILPGNFQTAGIALMLQGCDKVRTVSTGNSKAAEIGSVQPHGRVSSESITDDLKKEAVIHTVQHDDIEAKLGKNLQVSKKSHQEEDQKLYPKPIQTGDDATNKELDIACNGNPNENEKQLASEEHMEVSQGKAASAKEDGNLCTFNESNIKGEPSGKEDRLGEKDTCVSAVNAKSDVSNPPSSMKCDDRNSVKRDSITKCVKEDGTLCTFNESNIKGDPSGKEDRLGEKDTCVSTVNAKSDVSNQPSSMKSDDRNSVKRDSITKCVKEDGNLGTFNESNIKGDPSGKEDRLGEKDTCVSTVNAKSDVSNQPSSMKSDDRNSVKRDSITKCVKEDGNLGTFNESDIKGDPSGKEDRLGEKDTCVSAVNAKSDVSNQPSSMKSDDRNSVKRDSITKCVKEDGSLGTFNESNIKGDPSGKEDRLGEKDTCVSAVNAKSDVSNQPSSMKSDDRNSVKRDSITKCVKEDGNLGTFNESNIKGDPSGKEDGLGEKDTCVSTVHAKSDVSNQPSSMKSDDRNSVKMDSITKCDGQANSDGQPPQADKKEEAPRDLQSSDMCANGSVLTADQAITEKAPPTPPKMEADLSKPAVEEDESVPKTNDSIETGSKNKVEASFNNGSDGHGDCDTKSVIGEHMADNQTQKELLTNQSPSSQRETIEPETEKAEAKETDLISGETNKGLGESHSRIIIPFIGIDISREDILQPHDSHSQGNVDHSVQSQAGKVLISETVKPSDVSSAAQLHIKRAELSTGKSPLLGIPDINPLWASGSESDDRCPTPTMDEKPYHSGGKSSKNVTPKCARRSSVTGKEEKPVEQKPRKMSTVNGDLDTHHGLHPDLEARTLRVLQSIDKFLSKSNPKPGQMKTADMKQKPQTSNPNSKYILTSSLKDFKDQKMGNKKSAAVSAPTSQELQTEASGNFLILPYKNKMEEVLGVGLQHTHTDTSVHQRYFERTERSRQTSSGHDVCYPHQSLPSTGCLVAMDPTIDQDRHATSQANLSHDPHPFSQRPVMAVKPSKSEESQADCLSNKRLSENSMLSNFPPNKQTKTSLVPFASPTTKLLENKTQCLKNNSEGLDYRTQETCERLSKSSWMSHDSESNKATFAYQDPLCQYQGRDFSKFNKVSSSSLPVHTFVSAKMGPQRVDLKQAVMNSSAEKVGQTAKESLEIDQRNCSATSSSLVDYKDDDMDDSLYLGPDSSLSCTVYNTRGKRSYSLLEQLSQRCIQDDPTEASMEQECLIFSEKMKQLLKRTKMGLDHQLDVHGKSNLSCPSPVSVHFSGLEEHDVTVDHLDGLSLFGQKIKVDMSDRKDLEDLTEKGQTLNSKKSSKGAGTPIEHAGVSALTAECAELYEATMNNVCAVRDVPSKPKHFRMDRGYPKAEPSKYFDFCDQMKREMDESFRSSLNSVVKKSCKTKYRFYILETSDDAFFEETKAQLKAEGHTAVQPSEFFFSDGSPSLLIILRNEDISEHICEVPHLLELKKCPGVQFAGIDESDDVVNLTHQELFTRGGFIMLDRAALEPLSLCDLKKMSEILQELCKTGKWKWMLHYRDSRRLKENARLSAEAKEKQNFLNWCQEAGILEVLPYHECDLMSRDLPDYLTCLVRLQVQNITARFTVFITDATADSAAFDSNGIITMTFSSFLTCSPSEAFSV